MDPGQTRTPGLKGLKHKWISEHSQQEEQKRKAAAAIAAQQAKQEEEQRRKVEARKEAARLAAERHAKEELEAKAEAARLALVKQQEQEQQELKAAAERAAEEEAQRAEEQAKRQEETLRQEQEEQERKAREAAKKAEAEAAEAVRKKATKSAPVNRDLDDDLFTVLPTAPLADAVNNHDRSGALPKGDVRKLPRPPSSSNIGHTSSQRRAAGTSAAAAQEGPALDGDTPASKKPRLTGSTSTEALAPAPAHKKATPSSSAAPAAADRAEAAARPSSQPASKGTARSLQTGGVPNTATHELADAAERSGGETGASKAAGKAKPASANAPSTKGQIQAAQGDASGDAARPAAGAAAPKSSQRRAGGDIAEAPPAGPNEAVGCSGDKGGKSATSVCPRLVECVLESSSGAASFLMAQQTDSPVPKGTTGGQGESESSAFQSTTVDLSQVHSFADLWASLEAAFAAAGVTAGGGTPGGEAVSLSGSSLRLCYCDDEGDWLLVTPDEPWSVFAATARRILLAAHSG